MKNELKLSKVCASTLCKMILWSTIPLQKLNNFMLLQVWSLFRVLPQRTKIECLQVLFSFLGWNTPNILTNFLIFLNNSYSVSFRTKGGLTQATRSSPTHLMPSLKTVNQQPRSKTNEVVQHFFTILLVDLVTMLFAIFVWILCFLIQCFE